jgi:hypothetical protein
MNTEGHSSLMEPPPMEMSQNIQDEAAYISESFGVPFTTALEITLANAQKAAKKGKKRVDRK